MTRSRVMASFACVLMLGCSGTGPVPAPGTPQAGAPTPVLPGLAPPGAASGMSSMTAGTIAMTPAAMPQPAASGSRPTPSSGEAASDNGPAMVGPSAPGMAAQDMRPPEVAEHRADWPLPNLDYESTRATFESNIDSTTVDSLKELWRVQLPRPMSQSTFSGSLTSNPLIAGDLIILQDMGSNVFAIERATGAIRWQRHYELGTNGPNGVAIGYGKVFANYGDTGVVALDLANGEELWRYAPMLARGEGIDLQPLVYGGMVYVSTVPMSVRAAYVAGTHGIFVALDQNTGAVAWQFDTLHSDATSSAPLLDSGGGAWYPPTLDIARGRLYWGTGNPVPFPAGKRQLRPGDTLYTSGVLALNLSGGDAAWFHHEQEYDLFDWDFQNPPILVKGGTGGEDVLLGSGKTGTVVALSAATGALLWRTKVGMHINDGLHELSSGNVNVAPGVLGGVLTAPAYAEGVVFAPVVNLPTSYGSGGYSVNLGSAQGELVAVEISKGAILWSEPLGGAAYGAATVINDLVFTTDSNGGVVAFDRTSGMMRYQYTAPSGINAPLSAAGDMLLIAAGIGGSTLVALSL